MEPTSESAIADVGATGETTDMGSPEALDSFLAWGQQRYPAKRKMVIIWNHGQGWRFQVAANRAVKESASGAPITVTRKELAGLSTATGTIGGYRSVSSDEDTGSTLFNSDVAAVLAKHFSETKLDILGFDACLMAMIETGYAVMNSAEIMVGSEELEPGAGWPYRKWLSPLLKNPTTNRNDLAKIIVNSYRDQYGTSGLTTLSAVEIKKLGPVAKSLSGIADSVTGKLSTERKAINDARGGIRTYGDTAPYYLVTSIDLDFFLERYGRQTKDKDILRAISDVRSGIKDAVLVNYASTRSLQQFGSRGLAIYFPANRANFLKDPDSGGYHKDNVVHPVEFVRRERWADFLASYLR
jgi:hypothetical protein